MTRSRAALALLALAATLPLCRPVAAADPLSVDLSRSAIAVEAGERFSFTSTVTNQGGAARRGLIAHLNIASLDAAVYVDPEDWSPERTQYLEVLAAGDSAVHTWNLHAVGSGRFLLYVVLAQPEQSSAVVGSRPLRLDVSQRRTLNAGNVLPVAAGVPVAVLILLVSNGRRRRRR